MIISKNISDDINTYGDEKKSLCTRFTPECLPKIQKTALAEDLRIGAYISNALFESASKTIKRETKESITRNVFYIIYMLGKKAYDYLIRENVDVYNVNNKTIKKIDGKRKIIKRSRIPNIFFTCGTNKEIYYNVNLPHFRFYYCHLHEGAQIIKEFLIIPDYQIKGLKILYTFVPLDMHKFKTS